MPIIDKKKNNLSPVLRFKDYSLDWNKTSLGKLLTFKNGVNAAKEKYGKGYKFINVLDIIDSDFITHNSIRGSVEISEAEFNKNIVEYGDVLFQRSSETREEVGQANVYLDKNKPATFGGFVIKGKKVSDYDPAFMNYLLKVPSVRKDITSRSGGSTRYNIGQEALEKVSVIIPDLDEQEKIGDFLRTIDQWVKNLSLQRKSLESYKKGMMQKIFSQEFRFKNSDGKNYPAWKKYLLGDLFDERTEKNSKQSHDLLSVSINRGVTKQDLAEKRDSSSVDKSSYKVVYENDIAYNTMRMWQGASGVSPFIGIVSPAYTVVFPKWGNVNFYKHLFKQSRTIFNFYRYSQGMTSDTWNLKFQHFSEIEVDIPTSVEEQAKIASFLDSIDELITANQRQLTRMEEWKKGLLQQIFI